MGLLKRYSFADITILINTGENTYISLTDFSFDEFQETILFHIESDAKYLITFTVYEFGKDFYYSEITLDEIMLLAGTSKSTKFIKAITSRIPEKSITDSILAYISANKILNNCSGTVVREKDSMIYKYIKKNNDSMVLKKEFKSRPKITRI